MNLFFYVFSAYRFDFQSFEQTEDGNRRCLIHSVHRMADMKNENFILEIIADKQNIFVYDLCLITPSKTKLKNLKEELDVASNWEEVSETAHALKLQKNFILRPIIVLVGFRCFTETQITYAFSFLCCMQIGFKNSNSSIICGKLQRRNESKYQKFKDRNLICGITITFMLSHSRYDSTHRFS